MQRCHAKFLLAAITILFAAIAPGMAQQRTVLEGKVLDSTKSSIPGASLVLVPAEGQPITAETDALGEYQFANLTPGQYRLAVSSTGFQPIEIPALVISAGNNHRDFEMAVFLTRQEVTVEEDVPNTVSVDMASNASALVLKEADLQALSDDPDALANELQALAGPSAGPSGGAQIFVDGFSGGRVPPKQSIREVRINRDPYSAEFDRPGFGRIEILTKPGSDRFRGQTFFNFSDAQMYSRNPFAVNRAPYQARTYGGNLSGPISKRSSFFLIWSVAKSMTMRLSMPPPSTASFSLSLCSRPLSHHSVAPRGPVALTMH